MSKNDFLRNLDGKLSQLPEDERRKHTSYYEELIDDMIESGMSEYDAVKKLGDPGDIAKEILTDTPLPLLVKPKVRPSGGWTALTITLAVLSCPIWLPVAIALLMAILCIYVVLWAIVIAFIAVVLGLILGGLAVAIISPFVISASSGVAVFMIGCALAAIGFGILACYVVYWTAIGVVKLTKMMARWIRSLFVRKEV